MKNVILIYLSCLLLFTIQASQAGGGSRSVWVQAPLLCSHYEGSIVCGDPSKTLASEVKVWQSKQNGLDHLSFKGGMICQGDCLKNTENPSENYPTGTSTSESNGGSEVIAAGGVASAVGGALGAIQAQIANEAAVSHLIDQIKKSEAEIQNANQDNFRMYGQQQEYFNKLSFELDFKLGNFFSAQMAAVAAHNPPKGFQELLSTKKLLENPWLNRSYEFKGEALDSTINEFRNSILSGNFNATAELTEQIYYSGSEVTAENLTKSRVSHDGIFLPEVDHPEIPKSPMSQYEFDTQPLQNGGQLLRRVANEFQITWAETNGLSLMAGTETQAYLSGITLMRTSDAIYARGGPQSHTEGFAYLKASKALLDFSRGFKDGAIRELKETLLVVPELVETIGDAIESISRDPTLILQAADDLLLRVPTIIKGMKTSLITTIRTVINPNTPAYERGVAVGRLTTDWLLAYVGGKALRLGKELSGIENLKKLIHQKTPIAQFRKRGEKVILKLKIKFDPR